MRTFVIDEKHETEAQRATRLIEHYARRGWGVDDIQVALKRQHNITLGRNAVRAWVWDAQEKRT